VPPSNGVADAELPPDAAAAAQGEERREGGRRRRGRRGRGGNGGERVAGTAEAVAGGDETGVAEAAPTPQQLPIEPLATVPVDVAAIPLQVPQVPSPYRSEAQPALVPAPTPSAPASVHADAVAAPPREPRREPLVERAAEAAAPALPVAAPSRPRNLPEIPPITLALPLDSGLELVQTTMRAAEPEQEPAPAPRPKRVRAPRPVVADEPLQIVETRHGDGSTPPA